MVTGPLDCSDGYEVSINEGNPISKNKICQLSLKIIILPAIILIVSELTVTISNNITEAYVTDFFVVMSLTHV